MSRSENAKLLTAQETLEQVNKAFGIKDAYITRQNRVQIEAFGNVHGWVFGLTHPYAEHQFTIYSAIDDRMVGRPYVLIQLSTSDMTDDNPHVARLRYAGWIWDD